ncbi:MAG: NAD(P)(+) transhydrogenase (Re/Si-specific) subunit beta, partial [Pseudomonadota bacterium]
MEIQLLINLSYIISAILFVFGLKRMSSPATAKNGNLMSAIGMLLAIVVTLLNQGIVDYTWIIIAMIAGTIIGATASRLIAMTAMPEMVALFNGSGGLASLLVGWAALYQPDNNTSWVDWG